jgi:2-keto-4-pentenoate hydratase
VLAACTPLDPSDAYVQQRLAVEGRLKDDRVAGFKAAATTEASRARIGSDAPIFAVLFKSGRRVSGVRVAEIDGPRLVEAELGFVLAAPVHSLPQDRTALRELVADVRAVIELPAPRVRSLSRIRAADLIVDNAGSDLFIVGPSLLDQDPNAIVAQLSRDGVELGRGSGSDAMGDQWRALRWVIAQALVQGYELEEGLMLITGALGPVHPAEPGRYEADYGGARLNFTIEPSD